MKTCTKCNQTKKRNEFYKRKSSKDGLNLWCKICHVNNNNTWTKANLEFVKEKKREFYYADLNRVRNKELKHKFGITKDEYDDLHKTQNGKCKICDQKETTPGRNGKLRPLAVDHCHSTGVVRGLLCAKCNTGLGLLNESVFILEKAIEYLKAARLGKGATATGDVPPVES